MSEKTEPPTPKKLRDARRKGQVSKSQDVTAAALTVATFVVLGLLWIPAVSGLREMILLPAQFYGVPFEEALGKVAAGVGLAMLKILAPVLAVVVVTGIAANFFQVGALLVFEPVKPQIKRLNPVEKAKQIFSVKNFVEFLKSALKVVIIGFLVWIVTRDSIDPLTRLPHGGESAILEALGPVVKVLAVSVALAYVAIAAGDWFFQKHQFIKELKMSKDEVKREYKEMEGSPEIKAKRRQLHQEMVAGDTMARTRKASVVVTNPTHLAVAIHYREEDNLLPLVLAKGEDHIARRMVEVAREEGIPVMQHVPLARALHENVDIDRFIPADLIEPMAEVLRWVREAREAEEGDDGRG